MVHSLAFDSLCAAAIVLNTVFLGYTTHKMARSQLPPVQLPLYYQVIDIWFLVFFSLELCLRCGAEGPCYHYSARNPNHTWNYFDTLVVTLQIVETALSSMAGADGEKTLANINAMRILRVLRIARALRILRL